MGGEKNIDGLVIQITILLKEKHIYHTMAERDRVVL